jgi:hypothetical protein
MRCAAAEYGRKMLFGEPRRCINSEPKGKDQRLAITSIDLSGATAELEIAALHI